jgi:urease beta subunit
MNAARNNVLQLLLSAVPGARFDAENLPLIVSFKNNGDTPVRLLDHFQPLPVFFSFQVVKANGTPLLIPGGGKIDFSPGGMRYLELGPGHQRDVAVNPARLLTTPLQPGGYSVAVTYHNQYGEDCFHGTLQSNPVTVEIGSGSDR